MHFIRHLNQKRHGLIVPVRAGIRGEFRVVRRDFKGRVLDDSGWFNNLITDQGLENMGGRGESGYPWAYGMAIGSGSTPPSFSDTAMETPIKANSWNRCSNGIPVEGYGWNDPVPWMSMSNYCRFSSATGTVRELGLGAETQPTTNASLSPWLSCRQLLPDQITLQSTDILDVFYKGIWYFDTADATGQVTLDGILYDYVVRLGGLAGSNQGYTWGCTLENPRLRRTEGLDYSDGELVNTNQSDVNLGDLGANVSGNYTTVGFGDAAGVGERWNEISGSLNVDAVLPTQVVRVIYCHSWTARLGTQIRFGTVAADDPVPFTDKDIMNVRFRLYYDRYSPDLFASPGAYVLAGEDIATSVI